MPAEAALSLTDPEYRTMARTRLATPAISSGLTCAKRRAALGPWAFVLTPAQDRPDADATWLSVRSGRSGPTTGS
eukprot:11631343-Alexandrium_andersonii.AAC.1